MINSIMTNNKKRKRKDENNTEWLDKVINDLVQKASQQEFKIIFKESIFEKFNKGFYLKEIFL